MRYKAYATLVFQGVKRSINNKAKFLNLSSFVVGVSFPEQEQWHRVSLEGDADWKCHTGVVLQRMFVDVCSTCLGRRWEWAKVNSTKRMQKWCAFVSEFKNWRSLRFILSSWKSDRLQFIDWCLGKMKTNGFGQRCLGYLAHRHKALQMASWVNWKRTWELSQQNVFQITFFQKPWNRKKLKFSDYVSCLLEPNIDLKQFFVVCQFWHFP